MLGFAALLLTPVLVYFLARSAPSINSFVTAKMKGYEGRHEIPKQGGPCTLIGDVWDEEKLKNTGWKASVNGPNCGGRCFGDIIDGYCYFPQKES